MCCGADLFLACIAVLFPPIAVWVKCGLCSADSLINILLSSLGYIPGLLHAWYIIAKYPDELDYERVPGRDFESGGGGGVGHRSERITYVFVPAPQAHSQSQSHAKSGSGAVNYGTTSSTPNANPNAGSSSSPSAPASGPSHHQDDQGHNGQGSDDHRAPPTYAEAVKGDYKVQSDD